MCALPWRAARAMFETQHDFNYLDTDTLKTQCIITNKAITVRDMAYQAVIIDGPGFADAAALDLLKPMSDAGRVIAYRDAVPGVSITAPDAATLAKTLDALVFPDVRIVPANPDLRYLHLRLPEANVYLFANEGRAAIESKLYIATYPPQQWWDPQTAQVIEDAPMDRLALPPLTTRILVAGA